MSTKKTKIMIINSPEISSYDFRIYCKKTEIVDPFNYLGIIFSKNGNFQLAIEELSKKATRAYYALREDLI